MDRFRDKYGNPLPPDNMPLGSGTPLAGLLDIDAMNAVNGIDPLAQLGQNVGMDQFSLGQPQAGMPEIDLSGQIAPLTPEQLQEPVGTSNTEGPSEQDKLAAAQVVLGTSPPQTVGQKVGSESTTKTQQIQSQESKDAAGALAQSQKDSQAATQMELKAVADEANLKAQVDKEDQEAIATVENARAQVQMDNQAKLQTQLADIDTKVAELANFRPESFWGSKTASDKVAASLSIGLGAFGQALLGSGQNIGQVLLERNMQEFDRNQQMQYNSKLKQIEGMRTSMSVKRDLAEDAEKTFDAQKLAARAHIQANNAKALAMAKTPSVQAAIMQRQAKLDQDVAKAQAEIASKYEQRVTSTSQQDIIKQVAIQNSMAGQKEKQERVDELGKSVTKLSPIRSEIATALEQMKNPKLSDEDKIRVGQGLVKTLNSTQGSDAVGAEEASRLAAELETSFGSLAKGAAVGGSGGATAGALIGGVPTLGVGAGPGAAIGGVLGAVGGLGVAAADQLSKPGGIRFSPDIKGFTNRVQGVLDKLDGTMTRQTKIQELVKQGLTIPQANKILDAESK